MTRDQAIEIARREALRSREGHSYLPVNADTWMPHEWVIDAILAASEVGPTEVDLWAEIHRLRAAVKGPEGFASWQQAATAERGRRARYERELRNISEAQRFDRSAFEVPEQNPADFDGEALRPYNVSADALLLNYKSVSFTFTPDAQRGVAVVSFEPPLEGVQVDTRVPLAAGVGATQCADWRAALQADFSDPQRLRCTAQGLHDVRVHREAGQPERHAAHHAARAVRVVGARHSPGRAASRRRIPQRHVIQDEIWKHAVCQTT